MHAESPVPQDRSAKRCPVAARIAEREASDHFLSLPDDVREELRVRWRAELGRAARREELRRSRRWQSVLTGAALFLVVTVVWDVATLVTVPCAVLIGALTGWLWDALDVDRFGALATVIPGYLVMCTLGPARSPFVMFFGAVAMASLATLCGAMREIAMGDVDPPRFLHWKRRS